MRDPNFEYPPQEEYIDQFWVKFDHYLNGLTDDQRDEITQYLMDGWEKAQELKK